MASLTEPRRLAQLPGYDTAPDVYETPSSQLSASNASGSPATGADDDDDDDNEDAGTLSDVSTATSATTSSSTSSANAATTAEAGNRGGSGAAAASNHHHHHPSTVSRRRLYPSRARKHFASAAATTDFRTRKTDLSDRVDGHRQGYRVRARRDGEGAPQTGAEAGAEGLADGKGSGAVAVRESLEGRIARLKREVEECRAEAARQKKIRRGTAGAGVKVSAPGGWEAGEEGPEGGEGQGEGEEDEDEMAGLGKALAALEVPARGRGRGAGRQDGGAGGEAASSGYTSRAGAEGDVQGEAAELREGKASALGRLAAFDGRLAALEAALGTSSLEASGPGGGSGGAGAVAASAGAPAPLLPTLALLDQQFAALNTASSLAGLEALGARIAGLKVEARKLATANLVPAEDEDEDDEENDAEAEGNAASAAASSGITADERRRLGELYAVLPTLTALAPTVPALLARLKSLRTLHGAAATAAAELDALEQRQVEFAAGMKAWREGLEKVEEAVEEANAANGKNGRMVKEWVDDLDGRVKALGK